MMIPPAETRNYFYEKIVWIYFVCICIFESVTEIIRICFPQGRWCFLAGVHFHIVYVSPALN